MQDDDVGSATGYTIHATKKLLDRVKAPITEPRDPTSTLGNWYATAWTWRPQIALFVNEQTLLPVLLPLAPAATVARRFPAALRTVLDAHGIDPRFVADELEQMGEARFAKTASRSLLGVMNEFTFLGDAYRDPGPLDDTELLRLSLRLAGTPMGPLHKRHGFPDLELRALVEHTLAG